LTSGIRNAIFLDLGSQTHFSESLVTVFWVKNTYKILSQLDIIKFYLFKKIIFTFVKFMATGKGTVLQKIFPLFFVLVGSGIRDPKSGIWDPG
jgi:hypothetical protein